MSSRELSSHKTGILTNNIVRTFVVLFKDQWEHVLNESSVKSAEQVWSCKTNKKNPYCAAGRKEYSHPVNN
jgi:hypothetical protein